MARKFSVEAVIEATDRASPVLKGTARNVKQLTDTILDMGEAVSTGLPGLGRWLKSLDKMKIAVGAGLAFALYKVIAAIGEFSRAVQDGIAPFAAQEQALTRMRQSLIATGEGGFKATNDLRAFATEMNNAAGVSKTMTFELVTLAKEMGATNAQAEEMVKAAIDLAAATDQDAAAAVRRLGSALRGNIKPLEELVPAVALLTEEQVKLGGATALVAEQFQGAANRALTDYNKAMSEVEASSERLRIALGGLAVGGDGVTEGYLDLAKAQRRLAGSVELAEGTFNPLIGFWTRLKARLVDVKRAALDLAITGLPFLFVRQQEAGESAETLAEKQARLRKEYEQQLEVLKELDEAYKVADRSTGTFGETTISLTSEIEEIQEQLDAHRLLLGANSDEYVRLEAIAGEKIDRLRERIQSLSDGLGDLPPVSDAAADSIDGLSDSSDRLAESQSGAREAIEGTTDALARQQAQARITAAEFDALVARQGQAAAIEAALSRGAQLELGGTRISFGGPGRGSRLVRGSSPGARYNAGGGFSVAGADGGYVTVGGGLRSYTSFRPLGS